MNEISIILSYPPNVNHYKRVGRIVTTKTGKLYQQKVNSDKTKYFFWETWMRIQKEGLKSFGDATIRVEVDVYPPDKRKRDLDGILKVLLDAMQKGGLYNDDYQIACLLVTRKTIIPQGQLIVRIKPL